MNVATIFAIAIIFLATGILLLVRSRRSDASGSMRATGAILVFIGAAGFVWVVVEFILFAFGQ